MPSSSALSVDRLFLSRFAGFREFIVEQCVGGRYVRLYLCYISNLRHLDRIKNVEQIEITFIFSKQ